MKINVTHIVRATLYGFVLFGAMLLLEFLMGAHDSGLFMKGFIASLLLGAVLEYVRERRKNRALANQ